MKSIYFIFLLSFLLHLSSFARITLNDDGVLQTTSFATPLPGDIACSYAYAQALEIAQTGCLKHGFHWDTQKGGCINPKNQLFLAGESTEDLHGAFNHCNATLATSLQSANKNWLSKLREDFSAPPQDEVYEIPEGALFSPAYVVFPVADQSGHWITRRLVSGENRPNTGQAMGDYPAVTRPIAAISLLLGFEHLYRGSPLGPNPNNGFGYFIKLSPDQRTLGYKAAFIQIPHMHLSQDAPIAIFLPSVHLLNQHLDAWNLVMKRNVFAFRLKESSVESEDILPYLRSISESLQFPIAQTSDTDATVAVHDHLAHMLGFILTPPAWYERTQSILQFWLAFYDSLEEQRQKDMLARMVLHDMAIAIDTVYANVGIHFASQHEFLTNHGWSKGFTRQYPGLEFFAATYFDSNFHQQLRRKKIDQNFSGFISLWNSDRYVAKLASALVYNTENSDPTRIFDSFKKELDIADLSAINPNYATVITNRLQKNADTLEEVLRAYQQFKRSVPEPPKDLPNQTKLREEFDKRLASDFPFWKI